MIDLSTNPFNLNDEQIQKVTKICSDMTLDEKIGQIFCPIGNVQDEKEIDEEDKGGIITTDEYNEDDEVCITTIMYNPDSDCSGFQIMYDTDKVTASNYMYMALEKMFTDIFPGFNRNLFAVNVGKAILDSAIVHNTIFGKSIDE